LLTQQHHAVAGRREGEIQETEFGRGKAREEASRREGGMLNDEGRMRVERGVPRS